MKAAFWNYYSFSYVGSYEIADGFSPSWDLLVPQSCIMEIAGDTLIEKMMVVVVPVQHGRVFIGLVRDVKKSDSGITSVTAQEILSILDVPIALQPFSATDEPGGPNDYLLGEVNDYFGNSGDSYQTLSWLDVNDVGGTASASPAWSANEISTALSVLEEFTDAYDTVAEFTLTNDNTEIVCNFNYSSNLGTYTLDLRTDCFSQISFTDNSTTAVNKVVFKPMSDNYINTFTVYSYVLLSDGTVSTDLASVKRLTPVVSEIEFYSDEDLGGTAADPSSLAVSAASILNVNKYSHEVKFRMRHHKVSTYLQSAFAAITCGMLLTLYGVPGHETEAIQTKVTRVRVTGDDEIEVTCGYSRSQLTDKINMRGRFVDKGKKLCYSLESKTKTESFDFENADFNGTYVIDETITLPQNSMYTGVEVRIDDGTSSDQVGRDRRLLQHYSVTLTTSGGVTSIRVVTGDLTDDSSFIGSTASADNWIIMYVTYTYSQLRTMNVK